MSNKANGDQAIFNFLQSAADVLALAVEQARRDDHLAVEAMSGALAKGAMLSLKATLVPSTGVALLEVDFVDLAGDSHGILKCELNREVRQ